MSAFLGPIHHWLYKKIQIQQQWVNQISKKALEKNYLSEGELSAILEPYGIVKTDPLEAIIDSDNIHGWLQTEIDKAEYRLAVLVSALGSHQEMLKELFYRDGESYDLQTLKTPHEIFGFLNDSLLDGMPCDRVNQIVIEDADQLEWKMTSDIHKKYWQGQRLDISLYYELRRAWINGALAQSAFKLLMERAESESDQKENWKIVRR